MSDIPGKLIQEGLSLPHAYFCDYDATRKTKHKILACVVPTFFLFFVTIDANWLQS